jgi:hypothetical protein
MARNGAKMKRKGAENAETPREVPQKAQKEAEEGLQN